MRWRERFWIEICIKNIILFGLSILMYPVIQSSFSQITDKDTLETLILFVGLIVVVPLFANFEFSYGETKNKSIAQRFLGYSSCRKIIEKFRKSEQISICQKTCQKNADKH